MIERIHDGISYAVYKNPGKPVAILLHGFPQDAQTWTKIAESLSSEHEVLVPRQRGYEPSTAPKSISKYSIRKLAADVCNIAISEKYTGVHLVGHDLGGSVVWHLARNNPGFVLSATILAMPEPRALFRSFFGRQLLKSWYIPILQVPGTKKLLVEYRNGFLARSILTRMGLDEPHIERYVSAMEAGTEGPFRWYRAMPYNISEGLDKRKVETRTHLIWGTADAAVSKSGITRSADWCTDLKIVIIEGAGHWLPELNSEEVIELVAKTIKG